MKVEDLALQGQKPKRCYFWKDLGLSVLALSLAICLIILPIAYIPTQSPMVCLISPSANVIREINVWAWTVSIVWGVWTERSLKWRRQGDTLQTSRLRR